MERQSVDMNALYEQYRGLCYYLARRFRWALEADPAIDLDDLAQAAFLGLVAAAQTYRPDGGKSFAGWAAWYAGREVRKLLGWVRSDAPPPAHCFTSSLDAPLSDDGDDSKLDMLEDEAAEFAGHIDDGIDAGLLRRTLCEAIERLPAPEREALQRVDLSGQTATQAAQSLGVSVSAVSANRAKGLRKLRRDGDLKRRLLLGDWIPTFSVGYGAFSREGSQTERAALWLIEEKERRAAILADCARGSDEARAQMLEEWHRSNRGE